MLVEALLVRSRTSAVNVSRNLLVEWLLFLLLRRVEGHRSRRLDAGNRHSFLRTWLVHGKLALPIFAVGRFLR